MPDYSANRKALASLGKILQDMSVEEKRGWLSRVIGQSTALRPITPKEVKRPFYRDDAALEQALAEAGAYTKGLGYFHQLRDELRVDKYNAPVTLSFTDNNEAYYQPAGRYAVINPKHSVIVPEDRAEVSGVQKKYRYIRPEEVLLHEVGNHAGQVNDPIEPIGAMVRTLRQIPLRHRMRDTYISLPVELTQAVASAQSGYNAIHGKRLGTKDEAAQFLKNVFQNKDITRARELRGLGNEQLRLYQYLNTIKTKRPDKFDRVLDDVATVFPGTV